MKTLLKVQCYTFTNDNLSYSFINYNIPSLKIKDFIFKKYIKYDEFVLFFSLVTWIVRTRRLYSRCSFRINGVRYLIREKMMYYEKLVDILEYAADMDEKNPH